MAEPRKICVLGDRDSVLGFRAIGLETHFADTPEEGAAKLKALAPEAAILYITETLAKGLTTEISAYQDQLSPAIILIPGKEGSLGLGQTQMDAAAERAVGSVL